ncbi:hypothetical protein FOZ62_022727 [Perkinsus olseni]|uniref:Poly(A) RNA polymerase mitochondrial-like central palm domain-containing protein n=1 Tax=Perkinsus olseni TaxID=32597 RepID=A0A7J6QKT2_PEROL|nr:hypothetical protein FOZ62_022727 [Perkinsus olseni]
MTAFSYDPSVCHCPRVIRNSPHIPLSAKTGWSREIVKVTVGLIHTCEGAGSKELLTMSPVNRRDISPSSLPPSALLYPCRAWEQFTPVRPGKRPVDHLLVSVDIDLKGGRLLAAAVPDVLCEGLLASLRRICEIMTTMAEALPILEVTVDVSNTPPHQAMGLCCFLSHFLIGVSNLVEQLRRREVDKENSEEWYDDEPLIEIEITRLRMAHCGLSLQHLTQPLLASRPRVNSPAWPVALGSWDLSSNSINIERRADIGDSSLLSTVKCVCKTIKEVDISWNPPGCADLFRSVLPTYPYPAKIIAASAVLLREEKVEPRKEPSDAFEFNRTQKWPLQPVANGRSAVEWERILSEVLLSRVNDVLTKVFGDHTKYGDAYIRVFGSSLSGFALASSKESDVDAVVLLRGHERSIEDNLDEGLSSPWHRRSRGFVSALSSSLPRRPTSFKRTRGYFYRVQVSEAVPRARVPIVKLKLTLAEDDSVPLEVVQVDVSFMNLLGVKNSELLREYGRQQQHPANRPSAPPRLHPCVIPVVCAVKGWTKQNRLVSAKSNNFRRLTSYAWTMMVIFYLQVRVGLLPSLQRPPFKKRGGSRQPTFFLDSDDEDLQTAIFRREICPHYHDYRLEDVDQLVRGFFRFYSFGEFLYSSPIDITTGTVSPPPTQQQLSKVSSAVRAGRCLPRPVIRDPFLRQKDLASNCRDWELVYRALRSRATA